MHIGVGVGAEVGKDEDTVIAVVGVTNRGQQDPAGAESGEQQRVKPLLGRHVSSH
jgi:hypothetical protein